MQWHSSHYVVQRTMLSFAMQETLSCMAYPSLTCVKHLRSTKRSVDESKCQTRSLPDDKGAPFSFSNKEVFPVLKSPEFILTCEKHHRQQLQQQTERIMLTIVVFTCLPLMANTFKSRNHEMLLIVFHVVFDYFLSHAILLICIISRKASVWESVCLWKVCVCVYSSAQVHLSSQRFKKHL